MNIDILNAYCGSVLVSRPTLVSGSVHIVSSIGRWLKSRCPHCPDFGWPDPGPAGAGSKCDPCLANAVLSDSWRLSAGAVRSAPADASGSVTLMRLCFLTLGDCQPELFSTVPADASGSVTLMRPCCLLRFEAALRRYTNLSVPRHFLELFHTFDLTSREATRRI